MESPAPDSHAAAQISPQSAGARRLIAQSDALMRALYPAESNHLESIEALLRPNVCFLGIEVAGELVACGAFKQLQDDVAYGEIKRVFVLPEHRGRGLARLETGIAQPEALQLYRRLGYQERGPFGSYRPDPLSVFMEKRIGPLRERRA